MKKILNSEIFFFILGAIIFSSIGVVFAYSITASNIGFTPREVTWNVNNVSSALDDIHDVSIEKLMALKSSDVKGTYRQAHGTSNYSLSANFSKGKYFVFAIRSGGGGINATNYSNVSAGGMGITATNGTCTTIDSYYFSSGGNSVTYSNTYRFENRLSFGFFVCTFTSDGSITTSAMSTNAYDPDSYALRYIKVDNR